MRKADTKPNVTIGLDRENPIGAYCELIGRWRPIRTQGELRRRSRRSVTRPTRLPLGSNSRDDAATQP